MTLTTQWDSLFDKHAGDLPVPFLRALSKKESNFNPSESNLPAYGLMQVVSQVRTSYNSRFGTGYSHPDLLNPDVNDKVATELLNRIAKQDTRLHSDRNMQEDWTNPEFVKLLIAGWNSGYSEAGGVGKVAKYLEGRGMPVTHDNVFRNWAAAGGSRPSFLASDQKYKWQRGVSDLYFAQPDRPRGIGMFLVKVGIAGALGYGFYRLLPGAKA